MLRLLLTLLAILTTGHSAVNEVEVKVHGVLGDWGDNAIEVGKKVVVECAGQWREEVTYSASFTKGGFHDQYLKAEGVARPQFFQFTPSIEQRGKRTEVKCEVKKKTDGSFDLPVEASLPVSIVFAPQPLEGLFVAVDRVGAPATALLSVLANPPVQPSSVSWELPRSFADDITVNSNDPGYSLRVVEETDFTTTIKMHITSVSKEDLRPNTVTLHNALGRAMYKVHFFEPKKAQVFISPPPEVVLVGSRSSITCTSVGGNPPPELEARVEVRRRPQRQLAPTGVEEGRGSHKKRSFLLDPRVEEHSEDTKVVCEAVQAAGGEAVFHGVTAEADLNIEFPPQPQGDKYVLANVDEPAEVTLVVEAFPRPTRHQIQGGTFIETNSEDNYRMDISFPSSSTVKIVITVKRVDEEEYKIQHSVTVWNEHGRQVYYLRVSKPIPAWVWVLVALAILALIVGVTVGVVVAKGTRGSRGARRQASVRRQAGTPQVTAAETAAETRTPMLEETKLESNIGLGS